MKSTVTAAILSLAFVSVSANAHGHKCAPPSLQVVASYAIGDVPESITVDRHGDIFYSNGNTIRRRTTRGQESVFATIPEPVFALGVKVGSDGCVYNTSVSLDPTIPGAYVWKTCVPGTVAKRFATLDQAGGPNDLAFDDDGNAFVTDPFLGKVWKVTRKGVASVWLSHPLLEGNYASPYLQFREQGVNGIAFDKSGRNLYLGNLDYGRILRVPVLSNGKAGAPSVWVSDPKLQGADGIAFDKDGGLYVAVNGQNKLVRVSPRGKIEVLFQGGRLDSPSSVVFGRKNDRDTLYVTSSAFLRTFGLETGMPAPAILKTTTPEKGLQLP